MIKNIMAKPHIFHYQNFTILKDQILGQGAYGAVYKAKCDQLMCAAKVLHATIVDPYDPGSGKILQRFQQECDFLNRIRHPHIVQYLGVCRDPESNLPVLLMELLDESLTKMLQNSPHPISYHIQVELCSDISLAVAYLHFNGIIHRDLSGNNVLVIAGRRAKVTDFGMSKLARTEHQTPLTLCPGTLGYMSPESLKDPPQYTEKLDVFSQGVIMIQVCTREFPDPGPAVKEMEDPRSPTGKIQVPILEEERRKNHIDLINPIHPLLPIAIACLEYSERDRPSAEELCQRLDVLKKNQKYINNGQDTTSNPATSDVNVALQQERNQLARQVHEKIKEIATKDRQIAAKNEQIAAHHEQIRVKTDDLTEQIAAKDRELEGIKKNFRELKQKLTDSETVMTQFADSSQQPQRQVRDHLFQNKSHLQRQSKVVLKPQMVSTEGWRNGEKAPFSSSGCCSVVDRNVAYFLSRDKVYSFDSSAGKWNTRLPPCPHVGGSLSIIQGLLTMVGGWLPSDSEVTNKLVSLVNTEGGKWIEQFPPMPTSRRRTTATTYQNHLIVAGGLSTAFNSDNLDTVEIFNIDTSVWSTAASLPHAFANGSATICGDRLYILGGDDKCGPCRSVFLCLLPELLQCYRRRSLLGRMVKLVQPSIEEPQVWQHITETPMYESTCATVRGQLLAVGGRDDSHERTSAVYKYDPKTRSWNVISHMTTARSLCYVAVMDTNELLVVGGARAGSYSVEIAHL